MRHRGVRLAILLAALLLSNGSVHATDVVTQDRALAETFPGATFQRRAIFLTPEQVQRVRDMGGSDIETKVIYRYDAMKGGKQIGTAYFDQHRVRTLPEVLMLALDAEDVIKDIRVLLFKEPPEYLPRRRWYEQFLGRTLESDLRIGRQINGITGATLTARATSRAARRMLAIHQTLSLSEP